MNYPNRNLNAMVLCVCCLILMPYAGADGLPDEGHFTFVTLSDGGLESGVLHRLVMTGRGEFDEDDVDGGGEFNHFDGNSAVPQTVIASGTWEARSLISWTPVAGPGPNPYGQVIAGLLVMEIRLFPDDNADDSNGIPATLTVVCNVPPAGNFVGLPEGIFLNVAGALSFAPILVPTAAPPPPLLPFGITLFTVGDDDDDDSDSDSD